MKSITQYRVVFNEGGTKWFSSQSEALDSVWMKEDGARIEYFLFSKSGAALERWHDAISGCSTDLRGRTFMLNLVRPVTKWRRFRAWLGWHEVDSLVGNTRRT